MTTIAAYIKSGQTYVASDQQVSTESTKHQDRHSKINVVTDFCIIAAAGVTTFCQFIEHEFTPELRKHFTEFTLESDHRYFQYNTLTPALILALEKSSDYLKKAAAGSEIMICLPGTIITGNPDIDDFHLHDYAPYGGIGSGINFALGAMYQEATRLAIHPDHQNVHGLEIVRAGIKAASYFDLYSSGEIDSHTVKFS